MPLLKYKKVALAGFLFTGTIFTSAAVSAETLMQALSQTYTNNAALNVKRASVRAQDETVALARSGFMPRISASGAFDAGWQKQTTMNTRTGSVQLQLSQNVFDSFSTYNTVSQAKAQASSNREDLLNEEQTQLSQAVNVYTEVYTTRNIAKLRQQNLAALEEQVRASRAKLNVGEGTRTDLAQAEAARARALADLVQAQADVKTAEASYRQIVGIEPGDLMEPNIASGLPSSIEEAYNIAIREHPAILGAKFAMDANVYNVNSNLGALGPKVDVTATTGYTSVYEGLNKGSGSSSSIRLGLTLPIFSGGADSARIRQAKEQLGAARINVDFYENKVRQALESSWAQLVGLRSALIASRDSVRAAKIALDGRVHENRVGQATTLDVLNSRSQLIDAQVALEKIKHSLVVASYNIKAAIGHMTFKNLGLAAQEYEPLHNYIRAERQIPGPITLDGR